MSAEVEEPTKTLIRLLRNNLQVVKDDGEVAQIYIGNEWYNSEISRQNDGQITVALQECQEQKLSADGKVRRAILDFRINVWVLDKPERSVEAREVRDKIVDEVRRVVNERNSNPNVFTYNFIGVGRNSGDHKAFYAVSNSEPSPSSQVWTELTDEEYTKIWYSDDERLAITAQQDGDHAFLLLKFKLDAKPEVLKSLKLDFEGYGESPAGSGITIKIWNFSSGCWDKASSGSNSLDETVSINLSSEFSSFIGDDGYIYLLARTTNPSDGVNPAILNCDYSEMEFSVNGICYCNVVSYRSLDIVNVRPFIWRTELYARGWMFERLI